MRHLTIVLLSLFSVVGIAQNQCLTDRYAHNATFDEADIIHHENVVYGNATQLFSGVDQDLIMDVFEPDPAIDPLSARPLIVMIHGGAFYAGQRSDMNYMCMEFAKRGFVAATVSYRLGWNCDPNAGIFTCAVCGGESASLLTAAYCAAQDGKAGIRFLLDDPSVYGVDPDWVFTGGLSAGAITALAIAFMDQAEADVLLPGAVAAAGPLDTSGNELTTPFSIKGVVNDCGAVFNASVIDADEQIGVISFHDEFDCVVPYGNGNVLSCLGCTAFPAASGSSIIHNQLTNLEICSELNTLQLSLGHCSWPQLNIVRRSSCFLKRQMCGVCTSSANNSTVAYSPCANLGVDASTPSDCPSDLNADGVVNAADLLEFLGAFGTVCP